MNALVNCPSPEELHHIFCDPPDPPELPAKRLLLPIHGNIGRRHRRRKFKLESQGQADRRVRRNYRAAMTEFYREVPYEEAKMRHELEMRFAGATTETSLYDFVMGSHKSPRTDTTQRSYESGQ